MCGTIEIDRAHVRVLSEEGDTRRCVEEYGVGNGAHATLDTLGRAAMARDGYSCVEVERGLILCGCPVDIESGVLWDTGAVRGAWPIAVRRPDGRYYRKVRGAGPAARATDIRLSETQKRLPHCEVTSEVRRDRDHLGTTSTATGAGTDGLEPGGTAHTAKVHNDPE